MTSPADRRHSRVILVLGLLSVLTAFGCGLREPQTGSLRGRVVNVKGDVVENAKIYSLFNEAETVYTGKDGSFYLSELPAGRNTIIIVHPSYKIEERMFDIGSSKMTEADVIRLDQANTPRLISETRVDNVTSSTAEVAWTTYKDLLCEVEYGTDQGYGRKIEERSPVTEHRVRITGLTPETIYHARVRFLDDASVLHFSYDLPFQTVAGDAPDASLTVRLLPLEAYGAVTTAWDLNTSKSVSGYRVWRRENNGAETLVTTDVLDRTTSQFRDSTAIGGRFYAYGVQTVNEKGAASPITWTSRIFMPGFINEQLTLTASDSPFILVSDLIVGIGVNLYIEPGVEIRIASGDAFRIGLDPDRIEVLVNGRVSMAGTEGSPIRFTPLDGAGRRDHWAGINIRAGGTGASELFWVELFGCKDYAVRVDGVAANVHDLSVRFSEGGYAVSNIRNPPTLTGCRFEDIASTAVAVTACRRFECTTTVIENAAVGIRFLAGDAEDRVTLRETDIRASVVGVSGDFRRSVLANNLIVVPNGVGVEFLDAVEDENDLDHCTIDARTGVLINKGSPRIRNNIITSVAEDGATGIQCLTNANPQFDFNDVFGFTNAYLGCLSGTGARVLEPDFVGGNPYDYHLQPSTPLGIGDAYGQEMGRYGQSYL